MPDRAASCLATLVPSAPARPHSAFEVKWDGDRLQIHRDPAGIRIFPAGGHEGTLRFPPALGCSIQESPSQGRSPPQKRGWDLRLLWQDDRPANESRE